MAASIGLRVYSFSVRKKHSRSEAIALADSALTVKTPSFLWQFVTRHTGEPIQHNDLERSWYFEPKENNKDGSSKGYVKYGTFGFESNLVDAKTKKKNYTRRISDVEEIPLFFEIWCPSPNFGLIAFQSFQGRSCIAIVMDRIQKHFEAENPGFIISFRKLLPNDVKGSLYSSSPVKRLTLIKHNAPSDVTDRYFSGTPAVAVDFEVSLYARRSKNLGNLGTVFESLNHDAAGVVVHEGISFNEAVAQISVGGRLRRVGVFGSDSEAGVIDLTESLTKGPDGHPTFDSLSEQAAIILKDFHKALSS